MPSTDLVTLADVKAWIYKTPADAATTTNDALISALITRTSRLVMSYLQRPTLGLHEVDEIRSGVGGEYMLLAQWPVVSVSSVEVDGRAIPQSVPAANGYRLPGWSLMPWDGAPPGTMQELSLSGHAFARGRQNIEIVYRAGYAVLDEMQTIASASSQYAVTGAQIYGAWVADEGVTYANGIPLAAVASNPSAGQYALDPANAGRYLFNSADNNAVVLISYSFTPADIAQALIEWIAERYAYMSRVGETTKSAGGQISVSYIVKGMPDFVAQALIPYRRVVPL